MDSMDREVANLRFTLPKPSDNLSLEGLAHSISSAYRTGKLNYVVYGNIFIKTSGDKQRDNEFLGILRNVDPIASTIVKIVTSFD